MDYLVPLTDVTVDQAEVEAASVVLRSGWLTQGAHVEAFEQAFGQALGARHAIAVTNGTAALHLAYTAAGLKAGDEFIAPALTFVATLNAGLYLGAHPVLADCTSSDDLTISVEDVEAKITPRTRLIVAMAYGGFCPDMQRLSDLAARRGIALVEDACHAPLARLEGRSLGTFGVAGAFSFFGNKNLTTGEGGMIVTNDEIIAKRLRRLRSHGMTTPTWDRHRGRATEYDVTEPGYNYRMDEIRAALGLTQLQKLPDATQRRRQAASHLRWAIEDLDLPGLEIPFANPRGWPVHHLFVILLPPGMDRDVFRAAMDRKGIQTSLHYPLPHRFSFAAGVWDDPKALRLPIVESLAPRLVTLPMGPHLDDRAVTLVAAAVRHAFRA